MQKNNTTEPTPTSTQHKAGFVNILGRPNAGKSTLMNELVGERLAIITSKAQTTRHRIIGIVNQPHYQIVYSDTPGIIDPKYKMQNAMMRFVSTAFKDADVLLLIVDINETLDDLQLFKEQIDKLQVPILFLLNKIDNAKSQQQVIEKLNYWKKHIKASEYLPISALHKFNIDQLQNRILHYLPFAPPYYNKEELTDRPERFFVAEIIREKILLNYRQEIPYSVEVVIENFKEEEKITKIRAVIFTNRESQKPILIGKGGSKLKKVGIDARKDIQTFLQKKVFLELFVKVKENWRDDDFTLKNLGYQ